jgi:lipopolysaccharide biosynthesis glycosyltransferase
VTTPLSIALASDEGYIDGLVGTLSGVARSARGKIIQAIILDCGLADADWRKLSRHLAASFSHLHLIRQIISPDRLQIFNPHNRIIRLTNSAYARLLLPELLLHQARIVYLDCDLFVDADLTPLFTIPLDGALVAAVQDNHLGTLGQIIPHAGLTATELKLPAFNSGVMLMDLAALRGINLAAQISAFPPSFQGKLQDQGALNYLLRRKWKPLPAKWNRQKFVTENFSIYRDSPDSVWHFIGKMKPWHFAPQHARGLMADFQRDLIASGWPPHFRGEWRSRSPAWRDSIKATRAFTLRMLRTAIPQAFISCDGARGAVRSA